MAAGPRGPVSGAAAARAAAWCEYLAAHARRLYAAVTDAARVAAALLATRLARGRLASSFTAREVYRQEWTGLTEPRARISARSFFTPEPRQSRLSRAHVPPSRSRRWARPLPTAARRTGHELRSHTRCGAEEADKGHEPGWEQRDQPEGGRLVTSLSPFSSVKRSPTWNCIA